MSDLMQKLAMSNARAIMGQTDSPRRQDSPYQSDIQQFDIPNAKYNIPQEFLQESPQQSSQPYLSALPVENTKPVGVPTMEAIKNSKLPDEIKKLMMENPIDQPSQPTMTMSNELIEKSRRLMGHKENNYIPESAKPKSSAPTQQQPQSNDGINYKLIQRMINEGITKALSENGLITESTEKSNETFSFKVGKHIFEGRVTKIKKIA